MYKTVAIIEGDITKKFNPVSKVKVNNSDTGESTWIPEDSKETHSLSVIKNGIYYAASDGLTAYDSVTVNVSPETEVNYEGIIANMPDLADLGLYDLDDLEGLEGLDLDLDELQDLENLILDGDLAEGELPDSGSSITGIDPDSGETLEVGLDEDGNLLEQALPDHIKIVVLPAKRHYQEGEIIDFSYMHVYLMKKGTERFTCEQYPTGEIPFEELIFPVTVAESSGEGGYSTDQVTEVTVAQPIPASSDAPTYTLKDWGTDGTYKPVESIANGARCVDVALIDQNESLVGGHLYGGQFVCVSTNDVSGETVAYDKYGNPETATRSYTAHGKTVYYYALSHTIYNESPEVISISGPITKRLDGPYLFPDARFDRVAWIIRYGDYTSGGESEIPVQWMRSDGEILEDTFEIEIGEGEDPEPEPDPYAGQCDFTWEGKKYCFNKSLARSEVMYSNGTVWQTWLGGQSPPYTVDQALKLKLIVQVT